MTRRALALVLLSGLALASPASADITYYVNYQTGHDPSAAESTTAYGWGASAEKPFRTIGYTNSRVWQPNTTNGHIIIYVADYTPAYDALPQPVNHPANGKRYFILGNISDPENCRVPGGTLYRAYVTLKGFRFTSTLSMDSTGANGAAAGQPYADSVSDCVLPGFNTAGAKYCTVVDCDILGSSIKFGGLSKDLDKVTVGNVYSDLRIHSLGTGSVNPEIGYLMKFDHLDSCSFRRVKSTIRVDLQGVQLGAVSMFMVRNTTFNQCRWDIYKTATDYLYTWKMRNWSFGNHFIADTIYQHGPARGDLYLMEKGGQNTGGQVADNISSNSPAYFDSCLFYNVNGYIAPNYDFSDWHFTYSTFVSFNFPAFSSFAGQMGDSVEFNHCTFATPAGQNTVEIDGSDNAWQSDLKLIFKNNIVAQFPYLGNSGTSGLVACNSQSPSGRDRNNSMYANNGVTARLDSVRGNVYWNLDYRSTAGDRTWYINGTCYGVGASATGSSSPLTALQAGKDKVSKHANPLFNIGPDSLVGGVRLFDGTIAGNSPAIGYGDGGSDAGAVAYAGAPTWAYVPSDDDTTTIADSEYAASYTDTFTVINNGTTDNLEATYTIQIGFPGTSITLDTTAVALVPGKARQFTVTYYTPGFDHPAGIYYDYIIFATNDPSRPIIYRPFVRTRGIFSIE